MPDFKNGCHEYPLCVEYHVSKDQTVLPINSTECLESSLYVEYHVSKDQTVLPFKSMGCHG